ncbi:DUF397 domain-containing protein [Streptomyces sp. 21So2-11]|uniref:DUF397 domain-containing protein n=1 Tax=Streptomyces sp. 21So2-11 TaxID=3144408 RepID=UPI00321BF9FC
MPAQEFRFRKSSHSGGNSGQECVEVALNVPGTVAVRDSRNLTRSLIRLKPATWSVFQRHIAQAPTRG